MITEKTKEKMPTIDTYAAVDQLMKKEVYNWLVENALKQIEAGKVPGPAMIRFLTLLKIVK